MIIGVPREIKVHEYRVGMTPAGAAELTREGHRVLVEAGAGEGSGFADDDFLRSGARVVGRDNLFGQAELIVKVKEPLPDEYALLQPGQALFTYLHLAPNEALARALLKRSVTAIGYETLEKGGALPLLAPMSEIAGRMAPLVGAFYLQRIHGGTGTLPPGVPGVAAGRALILGAGVVGSAAARVCLGLGMETTVMNRGIERLQSLDDIFNGRLRTLVLTADALADHLRDADLVVGALLVPGGRTPVLITRPMLATMRKGAVIVDVAVDQGGCVATSRPTTHDKPVYEVDGIIHYTVANMPGAYPRTSTLALTNATLPYVRLLANVGIEEALRRDPALGGALNTWRGGIAHHALAEALELPRVTFA
ncbi:alanine dehydrogenase [Geobacter sulfurreducens]|jgi:alanine dehydrogenase|uniref:Alanine dehydrogenase n=1 Tax=Geobacter sulfurreducens (strain ATCC 51573 / DSM 12127 / PCA) TaxID=243231 RepID=Q74AR0_GEOSL|nr:alanine dehydrogenase [Geobacter sulfurreducens]AAR35668.1 alanine dehydrogenase [Geobacter sulfurreducens PCA]ADI85052.1 alanine dehydrogenase [Geobacter sulfurreducens KN400]QVW34143.1 alanine dehydrogenase [Geobacter sulfurreducens]UAC03004.1 alanine dehydrogenase [Geobacter sulfurreducens]UTG91651.1 alanine dehydrogenase [Geobacter sulfurreducens]